MKTLITLLLFLPITLIAQNKATLQAKKVKPVALKVEPAKTIKTNKKVHALTLKTDPEYPGGMKELDKYVKSNFKMSRKDKKQEVEGEIIVKFTILKTGEVANVKVLNGGMSEKLNKKAIKVIESLPNWKAGTMSGKPVDVLFAYVIKVG